VTRISILAVLVLLLGLATCTSAAPAASPGATSSTAAAKRSAPDVDGDDECDCDDEPAPAAAAGPSAHEFKRVTPSAKYPLNACLITGEELGAVEDRVAFTYDGTEVQFCCPGCAKKFERDPSPYLAKLAAAKAK
jgi:YHS domain-containing protein